MSCFVWQLPLICFFLMICDWTGFMFFCMEQKVAICFFSVNIFWCFCWNTSFWQHSPSMFVTLVLLKMFCYRISVGQKVKRCSKTLIQWIDCLNLEMDSIQTKINQHRKISLRTHTHTHEHHKLHYISISRVFRSHANCLKIMTITNISSEALAYSFRLSNNTTTLFFVIQNRSICTLNMGNVNWSQLYVSLLILMLCTMTWMSSSPAASRGPSSLSSTLSSSSSLSSSSW